MNTTTEPTAPGPRRDALGLTLDAENVLERPPSIVLYGPPGAGKSTAMVQAFQRALFVCSAPTVLRPYASWLEDLRTRDPNRARQFLPLLDPSSTPGTSFVARKTLPEPGQLAAMGLTTQTALTSILTAFIDACAAGTCSYQGIVFDEASTFADRIYTENVRAFEGTKRRTWGNPAADATKTFLRWMLAVPRLTGRALGLVCHAVRPRYFSTYDEKIASANRGELEYRGGPALKPASSISEICAAADIVIQLDVEAAESNATAALFSVKESSKTEPGDDGLAPAITDARAKRRLFTEAHPSWERKFRDFRVLPVVTLDGRTDLRSLLERAGYRL